MQSLELLRCGPERGSGTRVIETIPVECPQDVAVTRLGETRDALCDVFLFEGGP